MVERYQKIAEEVDIDPAFVPIEITETAALDDKSIRQLADRFYALEVRDRTRMAEDVWARAGEDSLRGLFLRELRTRWDGAETEEERETVTRAARFGLAALDHRDLG